MTDEKISNLKNNSDFTPIQCRHFNGYKPCKYDKQKESENSSCNHQCLKYEKVSESILIIHLGALGAVVRSTALLKRIKELHPNGYITWVTSRRAADLLKNIPEIDQVIIDDENEVKKLRSFYFQKAYVIDKSKEAAGILNSLSIKDCVGFGVHPINGAIIPLNPSAQELWELGLNNFKKFKLNTKTEIQLTWESLELGEYFKPEYHLILNSEERQLSLKRRHVYQANLGQPVIGINTGCSSAIPYKKLSIDYHRKLILELIQLGFENIVLLGGIEDTERNKQIGFGLPVFQSHTEQGLRDGLISMNACDIVITGDSLGMHLAIGLKKYVIAWFGPTVANEIELYDRGVKILSAVDCGPCWKRHCQRPVMCYDLVPMQDFITSVTEGLKNWRHQNTQSVSELNL